MNRFTKCTLAIAGLLTLGAPGALRSGETTCAPDVHFGSKVAEMRYQLRQQGLDEEWLYVAKLEAGARLDSRVAREARNFFGMHVPSGKRRPTRATGRFGIYAQYPSLAEGVADLRHWADLRPRRADESFAQWLRNRRWNHQPTYYRTLERMWR